MTYRQQCMDTVAQCPITCKLFMLNPNDPIILRLLKPCLGSATTSTMQYCSILLFVTVDQARSMHATASDLYCLIILGEAV
jgi:hypothetical protein